MENGRKPKNRIFTQNTALRFSNDPQISRKIITKNCKIGLYLPKVKRHTMTILFDPDGFPEDAVTKTKSDVVNDDSDTATGSTKQSSTPPRWSVNSRNEHKRQSPMHRRPSDRIS